MPPYDYIVVFDEDVCVELLDSKELFTSYYVTVPNNMSIIMRIRICTQRQLRQENC